VAQDYDLWARLAEQGTIGNVPQKLIQKRTHAAAWGHQHSTNQRETASRAAARYAERLGLGPDSDDYRRLYAFLWWGEGQSDSEGDAIVEAFQRAIDYFAATGSQDAGEFWKSVAYFQRRLAWRCHEQARIHWTRPLTAAAWLRRARRIDPDHGGLLNTAKRKLCRTLGVPQQEFAAHSYAVC
jgi:hypothetical protein